MLVDDKNHIFKRVWVDGSCHDFPQVCFGPGILWKGPYFSTFCLLCIVLIFPDVFSPILLVKILSFNAKIIKHDLF